MSHIFISYSHRDSKYVEKLEQKLIEEGFSVWIDHRIDYGSQWTEAIENAIDSCDAYIVVMSEDAKESPWVQREVIHAERRKKSFFPLLLSGEFWFSLGNIQFVNVTNDSLPPEIFYKRLEKVTSRNKVEKNAKPAPTVEPKPNQQSKLPKLSIDSKIITRVFGILFVGVIMIFGFPKLVDFIGQFQFPTSESTIKPTKTRSVNPTSTLRAATESLITTNTPIPAILQSPTLLPGQITDSKGVPMILIPAGEFIMGSEIRNDEKPVHTVFLDSFYIDQYEVTNAFYKICVDDGTCQRPNITSNFNNSEYENHPVVYVDWNMATIYCIWRGAQLLTEAQWEKASRSTDGRTYPWGEDVDCTKANYADCVTDTTEVGSYESDKSVYGVYDMAGNVREWVADWYNAEYYAISPEANPLGSDTGVFRVLRGGSWHFNIDLVRSADRGWFNPSTFSSYVGFRCSR